ncbi:MAG: trypsin-like peptidase domain-containing protein [Acidobacteriota bacterium]
MENQLGRQSFTLALIVGAVVFGMVLAGGTDLTPSSLAESPAGTGEAVAVDLSGGGVTLPSFADLAEAVSPAVVSIQAVKIERGGRRGGDPLEFFFGPRGRRSPQREAPEGRRQDSSGSGFVISADGLIVTNHHVIEDADELVVALNGREYPAVVKGDDPATDLALLKIEPESPLTYLDLAAEESLRVGDWIMVIGSPLQLDNSVSVGVVSAMGRSINITPDSSLENFIQTDAAINFGNSGGPLVNTRGQVVGIATAINFGAENIGFAVPVSTLKTILPQLRDTGVVRRGYLGVNIADLGYEEAEAFGLPSTDGALVTTVVEDGPAAKAGLAYGDIILQVDDEKVASNRDLIDYVSAQTPESKVDLKVFRNGETLDLEVTLGTRPGGETPTEVEIEDEGAGIEWLGIQYQDLTPPIRQMHQLPDSLRGVWVTMVAPDSPLYDKGVRPGDVLIDVNGQKVDSVEELEAEVNGTASGQFLRIYLSRVNPQTGEVGASFFAVVRVP